MNSLASFFGSILLFFLFVIGFLIALGLVALSRLFGGFKNMWNVFTGKGMSASRSGSQRNKEYHSDGIYTEKPQQSATSSDQGHRPHSTGVFKDDEGTYVDFEEVK